MSAVAIVHSSYPNMSTNHTRVVNGTIIFAKENIWFNGHKVQIGGDFTDVARALNRHSIKTGVKAEVVFSDNLARLKLVVRGRSNLVINDPKGVFLSLQRGKNIGTSNDMLVQIICKGKVTWSYNRPTNPLTILGLISTDNIKVLNTYKDRQQIQPLGPLAEQLVPLVQPLGPLAEQLVPLAEELAPLAEELAPLVEQLELPPILTPPSLLLLGSGYKTPPLSSSLSRYETPPLSSSVSRSYETPPLSSSLSSSYETPPRTRKIIKPSPGAITEAARKHKSILGSGGTRRDFIAQLNWLKAYDSEFMSSKYYNYTTKVSWSPTEKSALLARYRQVQSLS